MKFASVKRKRWRADDVLVNTIKKLLSHPPVAARSTMCTEQTVSKGSRGGVGHRLVPSSCFSSSTEAVLAMPTAYGRLLTGSPAKCYLLELCNKCDREVYKTCTKCSKQQASVFSIHKYPSACPVLPRDRSFCPMCSCTRPNILPFGLLKFSKLTKFKCGKSTHGPPMASNFDQSNRL